LVVGAGALALACSDSSSNNPGDGGTTPEGGSNDASLPDSAPPPAKDAGTVDASDGSIAPQDATVDAPAPVDGAVDATAQDGATDGGDAGGGDGGPTPQGWMGALPGSTSLADLSIPGTHDTGATIEVSPGTTKCQNLSVADQLAIGVRYLDIRTHNTNNSFEVFHLTVDQNLTFDQVLTSIYTFFTANPGETVIMCLKEENPDPQTGSTNTYEQTFQSYVSQHPERWLLTDSIPTLDQARGKIVLLRRFNATTTPEGIDGTNWSDNVTFTMTSGTSTLRIQDFYQIPDDPSKWAAITGLFNEALTADASTLYLNNTSAYFELDGGAENITGVSDVINPELQTYFTDAGAGRYGIVAMDFVDATKASLVLKTNFK
jgi:1-phosphatidylinositol phosphodiesterase